MAAIFVSPPGTEYGPCIDACGHRDCAASREDASAVCRYCDSPIGYGHLWVNSAGPVHERCLEKAIEVAR